MESPVSGGPNCGLGKGFVHYNAAYYGGNLCLAEWGGLGGTTCSDFPALCCDPRHNNSCQLAHYGFCAELLSDVRRSLFFFFFLLTMKESSLCPPIPPQSRPTHQPTQRKTEPQKYYRGLRGGTICRLAEQTCNC